MRVPLQSLLWLHGGFRTPFPYPNIAARGGGSGTSRLTGVPEYNSFPTFPYYLSDMWIYNFSKWMGGLSVEYFYLVVFHFAPCDSWAPKFWSH